MQNKILRKGLIVGIIILFVGVSVLSSVSSKDVSVSNDKVDDDNNEVELLEDNQKEIYTIFKNQRVEYINVGDHVFPWFSIGYVEIYSYGGFTIKGYKSPLYPLNKSWFELDVRQVNAPLFIGRYWIDWIEEWTYVDGIAIGNIEWS